jgi:hypothetical protein
MNCPFQFSFDLKQLLYACLFPQIHDYQVAVKLGRGSMVLQKTQRVLHVLLSLRDFQYTYALITSLLVWRYQMKNKTFTWRMFLNNCAIFNEECGELAFGVLGRANVGDTKTNDFNHMNFVFSNLRVYMNASHGMRASSGHSEFESPKYGRHFIKPESEEVLAVTSHMKTIIRALTSNKYQMYDGDREGYRSIAQAHEHQVPLKDLKHFLGGDFEEMFVRRAERVEKTLAKGFLLGVPQYQIVWPELKVHNDAEALRLRELGEGQASEEDEEFGFDHDMEDAQPDVAAAHEKENPENDLEEDKHDEDEPEEAQNARNMSEEIPEVPSDLDDAQSDGEFFDDDDINSDEGADNAFNYEPHPQAAHNQGVPSPDHAQVRNEQYFSKTYS